VEETVSEQDLRELVINISSIENFKWLREDRNKMCLMRLPQIKDSVEVIAQ